MAGNAEEALLAVHFHIAERTKQRSRLKLESNEAFGEWFRRVNGIMGCAGWLGYLDLSGYDLQSQNFFAANFAMSHLNGANLSYSIFLLANVSGVQLEKADIRLANLQHANFEGANLKDADLFMANLRDAKLEGANLDGAILDEAILTGTILEKKEA
ncbi:pentapeptide repeat-containing protein [Candidatus Electrothrix sp.]|uniref:pentapeptide repeat-containing protein n=1 Tax=Candidatus Electrothrix sp. TaxID=2170559 RepID=UPI0040565D9A